MYNYFFNLLGRFSIGGNILAHIFLLLLLIVCITEIMFSNWENTVRKVGVLKISILIIGIDSAIQAIAEILEYFNISQSGSEDTFWLDLFLLGLSLVFCFIGFKKFRFVILGFIFVFLSGYLAYWIFSIIIAVILIGFFVWLIAICLFAFFVYRIFDSG